MEVDLLCTDARLAIELDGANISATPRPIAATGTKTCSCRRMAILCFGSSPRTSASDLTGFWMRFSERWRIDGLDEGARKAVVAHSIDPE